MTDWRGEVDSWWAEVLRLPAEAMRTGGIFALDHVDHAGVVAARHAAGPVIYGPPSALPALRAAGRLESDVAGRGRHLAAMLGSRGGRVLGPAWYGYATATTLAAPSHAVRALSEQDLPRLTRLREQTPAAERDESGTTGLPAFGYFDGSALLAVACLGRWHQMPTLGVLTHPSARGQGLARLVVTAAATHAMNWRAVVQYRAWHRNSASVTVATRSGFTHYCDGLVVDLAS